jgi:hypothetical protein
VRISIWALNFAMMFALALGIVFDMAEVRSQLAAQSR